MDHSQIFSLKGETAMITGGGTGIGRAIAQCMHRAGAKVILVGRREPELQAAVATMGDNAGYVVHDITDLDGAKDFVDAAIAAHGPITCLVNNAGIHLKKAAVETTTAEFQRVLQTHVLGAHALTVELAPKMMERRHGTIIFTASMASLFGIPKVIAYTAAKSAYVGMVKGLATEFSPYGIRVNAIAPGWIETDMSRKAFEGDPDRLKKILNRTPTGNLGQAEDVGWAAVYLASPAAHFVTGVILPVDGGVSIGF